MIGERIEQSNDLRETDPAYFHPYRNYSTEEAELFKEPTKFIHFKRRINLLIKRKRNDRLIFLPKGDGIFFKTLKLYVLNEIPTQKEKLSNKIYKYIGKKFTKKQRENMVDNYASYMNEVYKNE